MRTIGAYLIFAAVVMRATVVLSNSADFHATLALLAGYGLLLTWETWLERREPKGWLRSAFIQLAYLFLQSVLVVWVLVISSYEDFLAMLFIPLSLEAVSFFGMRTGYILIAAFSLAMIATLLLSDVGRLFGLAMGILYSGVCFLFGGYAHQVQKARTAHDQNEVMFRELQAAHRQLQGYADQVAALAIEHERNRLARELHDSVTQTVFSMNLAAQSAHLLLDREPLRATGQLLRLEELASGALSEIQSLISQLRPRASLEEGLPAALQRLALEHRVKHGLQVSLEIDGNGNVPETIATNLYAIAHEALTNISKHSGGCDAAIRVHMDNAHSCLEIEDHGRGFDPDTTFDERGHLGLTGMVERAHEIGWQLSVRSRPGQGTCIRVISNPSGEKE